MGDRHDQHELAPGRSTGCNAKKEDGREQAVFSPEAKEEGCKKEATLFPEEQELSEKKDTLSPEDQQVLQLALEKAILSRRIDKIERLLKRGADINGKKDLRHPRAAFPPVILSMQRLRQDNGVLALALLKLARRLRLVLDLDRADFYGHTALTWAACRRMTKVTRWLLKAGADPNSASHGNRRNGGGYTALMEAAEHNNVEDMKLLLLAKADPAQKDCKGGTALVWAKRGKKSRAVAILERERRRNACIVEGRASFLNHAASSVSWLVGKDCALASLLVRCAAGGSLLRFSNAAAAGQFPLGQRWAAEQAPQ